MNETPKTKPDWRIGRWILISVAILATLIAVFYTEEDWHGKRTWENYKSQLEAQGVVLDWNKFLPPSVPDDQNFFTASTNILLKFRQLKPDETNEIEFVRQSQWLRLDPLLTNNVPKFPILKTSNGAPLVIAKIFFISPAVSLPKFDTNTYSLTLKDPDLSKKIENIIHSTIGQTIDGAQGFEFSQFQLTNVNAAQIVISADNPPSVHDIENWIPSSVVKKFARLQVVPTASPWNFDVLLLGIHVTTAADYLKWSDQFVPAFDEIREALKRPYAIIPGDYSQPYRMPIPNFVTMRALAQTLAQRAQCYLLLGEPDKAFHELTLIHDVCRILEKPPVGQPETLVEAMINVAIHGLYVQVIGEGLQRQAWREPQLIALQQQLAQINLPTSVVRAFKMESAASTHTLETVPYTKVLALVTFDETKKHPFENFKYSLMPRGWIYQNMAALGRLESAWQDGFNTENETISPASIEDNMGVINKTISHPSPYNFYAAIYIPNFTKAWQTTAYNQTMVNEAQIACALERCRPEHGEYPDSLDMLVPKYIETLPHDIIGGQPLHYRRTEDGKFLLYSIGWNETDDGGKESPKVNYNGIDFGRGDWVWPATAK